MPFILRWAGELRYFCLLSVDFNYLVVLRWPRWWSFDRWLDHSTIFSCKQSREYFTTALKRKFKWFIILLNSDHTKLTHKIIGTTVECRTLFELLICCNNIQQLKTTKLQFFFFFCMSFWPSLFDHEWTNICHEMIIKNGFIIWHWPDRLVITCIKRNFWFWFTAGKHFRLKLN